MEAEVKITKSDNTIQENTIQLKQKNLVKFKILDEDGKDTGDYLEFDTGDVDLPFRWQEFAEQSKLNMANFKNRIFVINKKQDHKGKKLMSSNEEERFKAIKEFIEKETETYNLFLGENGVQKLLHGRNLNWDTLNEINDIMNEVIAPKLDLTFNNMVQRIEDKYSNTTKKEDKVLE